MGHRGLLACGVGLFGVRTIVKKSDGSVVTSQGQKQAVQLAAVNRTIDLFNHGTVRGGADPDPLEAVSLPSTLVHLHLILPRFSDAGSYVVAVSKDRAGTSIVARGAVKTQSNGQQLLLDVSLDLRGAQAGSYFLATVRESDNGTYYYPLNVRADEHSSQTPECGISQPSGEVHVENTSFQLAAVTRG